VFWIVQDTSTSPAVGLAFCVPHMFRMLLFILLAGFFARMGRERLGLAGFMRDRARRIATPLAGGVVSDARGDRPPARGMALQVAASRLHWPWYAAFPLVLARRPWRCCWAVTT
jgi:hypothetical protein